MGQDNWSDVGADAAAAAAAKAEPVMQLGADGKSEPKLDFLTAAEAESQAALLGGKVEHAGVAFHVAKG